LRREEEEKRRN